MERFKEFGVISIVVLTAAFGPGLLANSFYIELWKPEWVQAISSSIAVVVALFMPFFLRLSDEKKKKDSFLEMEMVALHLAVDDLFELNNFFSGVRGMLERKDFEELRAVAEGVCELDVGEIDFSSKKMIVLISNLRGRYSSKYLGAYKSRESLIGFLGVMLNQKIIAPENVGEDSLHMDYFVSLADSLCKEGKRKCMEVMHEANLRDSSLPDPYMMECYPE